VYKVPTLKFTSFTQKFKMGGGEPGPGEDGNHIHHCISLIIQVYKSQFSKLAYNVYNEVSNYGHILNLFTVLRRELRDHV